MYFINNSLQKNVITLWRGAQTSMTNKCFKLIGGIIERTSYKVTHPYKQLQIYKY